MPGTGVPVVCAGSGIVADMVDDFLRGKRRYKSGAQALFALVIIIQIISLAYFLLRA